MSLVLRRSSHALLTSTFPQECIRPVSPPLFPSRRDSVHYGAHAPPREPTFSMDRLEDLLSSADAMLQPSFDATTGQALIDQAFDELEEDPMSMTVFDRLRAFRSIAQMHATTLTA